MDLEYIPYMAVHLDTSSGLPYMDLKTMVQDRFGFLYFSTMGKGLFRFDGYGWHNFSSENCGLADDRIVDLCYDGKDSLYILHPQKGISLYNIVNESVQKLAFNSGKLNTLFSRIHPGPLGELIVLTASGGFYSVDPVTGNNTYFSGSSARLNVFTPGWQSFNAIFTDSEERIWLGAENGVSLFNGKEITAYYPFALKMRQRISQITEIPDGRILVFTDRYIGQVDEAAGNIKSFSEIKGAEEILKTQRMAPVNCFSLDSEGRYLLFTSGGAIVYDSFKERIYHLTYENHLLADNFVNNFFIDRNKNLWVTTLNGVSILKPSLFFNSYKIEDISISRANLKDESMHLFSEGLADAILYFPEDNFIVRFSGDRGFISDLSSLPERERVMYISANKDENRVGLYTGQEYSYNPSAGKFSPVKPLDFGKFVLDDGERIYRYYRIDGATRGLHILDKESGEVTIVQSRELHMGLNSSELYFFNKEKSKILLLQKVNVSQAHIYDIESGVLTRIYIETDLNISFNVERDRNNMRIAYDGAEGIWISFNDPFAMIFHYTAGKYTDYTSTFGLQGSLVNDIAIDLQGQLIIATANDGLMVYNGTAIRRYSISAGLPSVSLIGGISISEKGDIYILSDTALSFFNDIPLPPLIPDLRFIYLKDMKGQNSSIFLPGREDYMRLPVGLRDISVLVSGMAYTNEMELSYQFYLKGRDKDWSAPGRENFINFISLPPGNYELWARCTGSDGSSERSIRFQVPPDWFLTPPALIIMSLLFFLIFFLLIRLAIAWNTKRLRAKNKLLESLVAEKTAELKTQQQQLTYAAYASGKSEVAAEVMHTIGNLLNSMKIRISESTEAFKKNMLQGLRKANELLFKEFKGREDNTPKQKMLFDYYSVLEEELEKERELHMGRNEEVLYYSDMIQEVIQKQQAYTEAPAFVEPLELTAVVEDSLSFFSARLQGVTIHSLFSQDHSLVISGNRPRIIYILGCLYSNAIESMKAAGNQKPVINIDLMRQEGVIILKVSDQGTGIPQENLCKVFNFGFSTKSSGEKLRGFSLHSCANFMTEMKGRIRAESAGPGTGASFILEWREALQ